MCRNITSMLCIKCLRPRWVFVSSAPFCFVLCVNCAACRWANRERKPTAAASKSPTWLWYDLQLKLDLWPPSNHCIDSGIFLGNSLYCEGVLVSVSCDHVSVATGNVLWVALPLYFSIRLLGLCGKDHRGALLYLLSLRFLGKCWNCRRRVGSTQKVSLLKCQLGDAR